MTGPALRIGADDPRLLWAGAIEVEHNGGRSRGWRLPHSRIDLFPGGVHPGPDGYQLMAARIAPVLGRQMTQG